MKKTIPHQTKTVLIFCFFSFLFSTAHAEWTLLGLEEDTILSLVIDKANRIIAGTKSSGIKIYDADSAKWLDIPSKTLPVEDIIFNTNNSFITAMGAGSFSDGIYLAEAIDGPPYYQLSSLAIYSMMYAQSVACTPGGDTIFMGGRNTVACGIKNATSGDYENFTAIKTPENPFGVEKPRCAALHVLSAEYTQLYAGGYDESLEPAKGHLLWSLGSKDSLAINSMLNVTCITDLFKEQGGRHVFVGTKDSGIYYRIPPMSMPIAKYSESPGKGPVNDMMSITLPGIGTISAALCIAEKSGVFVRPANDWVEIDNIPVEPTCISGYLRIGGIDRYFLYAGTPKGVYVNNFTGVSIKNRPVNNTYNSLSVQCRNDRIMFISFSLPKQGKVTIDIANCAGRNIARINDGYLNAGMHSIAVKLTDTEKKTFPSGVYFIRVSTETEMINRMFTVVR